MFGDAAGLARFGCLAVERRFVAAGQQDDADGRRGRGRGQGQRLALGGLGRGQLGVQATVGAPQGEQDGHQGHGGGYLDQQQAAVGQPAPERRPRRGGQRGGHQGLIRRSVVAQGGVGDDDAAVGRGPPQPLLPLGASAGVEQALQLVSAPFLRRSLAHGAIIAQTIAVSKGRFNAKTQRRKERIKFFALSASWRLCVFLPFASLRLCVKSS